MFCDTKVHSNSSHLAISILFLVVLITPRAYSRRIQVGDTMPEFALPIFAESSELPDSLPGKFSYQPDRHRVLVLVFMDAKQEQSRRAVADIHQIFAYLRTRKQASYDVLGVQSVASLAAAPELHDLGKLEFSIGLDVGHQLWGKLGIMVTPTAMVVDSNSLVRWIEPGYGYDFASGLRLYLMEVLGIEDTSQLGKGLPVSVLVNATDPARALRRLRLAGLLADMAQLQPAIVELYRARDLDPNNLDVALTLGEYLCRTHKATEALSILETVTLSNRLDQSRGCLVAGWAHRLSNRMDQAKPLLVKAIQLNPQSSRAFFELGKVYQSEGLSDQALEAYRKALALVFDESLGPNR